MNKQSVINLSLLALSIVFLIGIVGILQQNKNSTKKYIDPDSKTAYVENRSHVDTRANPEQRLYIAVGEDIFHKKLTPNEYEVIVTHVSKYVNKDLKGKYKTGAINSESFQYDTPNETFRFDIRLGEPGSKEKVSVELKRTEFNIVSISILNKDEQVYYKDKINVHRTVQPRGFRE